MLGVLAVAVMVFVFIQQLYEDLEPLHATLIIIAIAVAAGGGFIYFRYTIDSKQDSNKHIAVQHRPDRVDVTTDNFTHIDPLGPLDYNVRDAWYDKDNKYMIIQLGDKYYHYCALPSDTWNGLNTTDHLYDYYKEHIKGSFDCRTHPAPNY